MTIWLIAFALGAAAALIAAVFGVLGFFFVLLVVPGLRRQTALAAVSGVSTGFGAVWLALMLRGSASGGELDDANLWLLVGVVPLLIGLALGILAILVARSRGP